MSSQPDDPFPSLFQMFCYSGEPGTAVSSPAPATTYLVSSPTALPFLPGMPRHSEQATQSSPNSQYVDQLPASLPLKDFRVSETPVFKFQHLPAELQLHILSYLDYPSLIALSCTNRFFNEIIYPQGAPEQDKIAFVLHAEKNFRKHFPNEDKDWPGNFGCYACFRVRGPELFLQRQLPGRRICTECHKDWPTDPFFGK